MGMGSTHARQLSCLHASASSACSTSSRIWECNLLVPAMWWLAQAIKAHVGRTRSNRVCQRYTHVRSYNMCTCNTLPPTPMLECASASLPVCLVRPFHTQCRLVTCYIFLRIGYLYSESTSGSSVTSMQEVTIGIHGDIQIQMCGCYGIGRFYHVSLNHCCQWKYKA